jgi:uncharacterized membrane protein
VKKAIGGRLRHNDWRISLGLKQAIARNKTMKKKLLIVTLATLTLLSIHPVEAQQAKKGPRIGFIDASGAPSSPSRSFEAFRQGLRDLGYIEDKNIVIELRYKFHRSCCRRVCG